MTERPPQLETRQMIATAVRRLNALEYILLGTAMVLASAAGALTAWLLQSAVGVPFKPAWVVASVLFFGVPGWAVLLRDRRAKGRQEGGGERSESKEMRDNGGR